MLAEDRVPSTALSSFKQQKAFVLIALKLSVSYIGYIGITGLITVCRPVHTVLKRLVSQDSPTKSRALRNFGWILFTSGTLLPRSFLITFSDFSLGNEQSSSWVTELCLLTGGGWTGGIEKFLKQVFPPPRHPQLSTLHHLHYIYCYWKTAFLFCIAWQFPESSRIRLRVLFQRLTKLQHLSFCLTMTKVHLARRCLLAVCTLCADDWKLVCKLKIWVKVKELNKQPSSFHWEQKQTNSWSWLYLVLFFKLKFLYGKSSLWQAHGKRAKITLTRLVSICRLVNILFCCCGSNK